PANKYAFMIILSPVTAYYKGKLKVLVSEKFSRAVDGGVGFAKAGGNYGASFYPTNLAKEQGFQQIIWTDACSHQYVEEAGTMNLFFRINDTLLTAPTGDRILDGVTRKSIIQLAKDQGIDVDVRKISVAELTEASENGSLKEVFGSGTAAVVAPIEAFSYQGKTYELPEVNDGFAERFKKVLNDIQYNAAPDPHAWRVEVSV
ncbi:MAG: aminotransferase class IV, partial [Flavobacteriaceae bacterium]|nr:aminotransferase class IV [Flavobacteriaceae bacterium]